MNRKIIVGGSILAAIVMLAGLALGARQWAGASASRKLRDMLAPMHFTADAEMSPVFSGPACFERMTFRGEAGTEVTLRRLCLAGGALSLMSGSPDLALSCESVTGSVDARDLKALLERGKSGGGAGGGGGARKVAAALDIESADVSIGTKGRSVHWKSAWTSVSYKDGAAGVTSEGVPLVDIEKAPFAIRNIPTLKVSAVADLRKKSATLGVISEPALEIGTAWLGTPVEIAVSGVSVTAGPEGTKAAIDGIGVRLPEVLGGTQAGVRRATVGLTPGVYAKEGIEKVGLESPTLEFDLDRLLADRRVAGHPVFGAMIRFWEQEAGAFLGDAPMDSVRRQDVLKSRAKKSARKNPIPKDKLAAVRAAFDRAQQRIRAWPSVEIENGRIAMTRGDAHYEFSAISFNTAELFKDSQKFRLAFNVREATASFEIAYGSESPYPEIAFDVQNMASPDFLHIINMPVPEQNSGSVSASLTASMSDDDLKLSGSIGFDGFSFYHEKISPNLVRDVNASASFAARYEFEDDRVTVEPLTLRSGPVTADGRIHVTDVRGEPVIEFELGAKDIACGDIPKAIPDGFLPTITDLEFIGTGMSPKIWGRIPWKSPLSSNLKESGFDGGCMPVSVLPHLPELLNRDDYTFTTNYTYFVDAITVGPGTKGYTPLGDIPPYVKAAMFLTEDKRFFDHGPLRIGFIERALRLNLNHRRYVYGGSTIGQQLAKNLFLNRTKNLARKLEEALVTWRMMTVVPRLRIFELYLNVIEFGPDIYGIDSAARFYFGKAPRDLTPLEGAFLASLKVAPSKGGRYYKSGFPQGGKKWWHKRMRYIMKVLAENGYVSAAEVVGAYNWTPEFSYPTDAGDFRQKWLNDYGEYLRQKARQGRLAEKEGAENEGGGDVGAGEDG